MFFKMTSHGGMKAVSDEEILAAAEDIRSRREDKKVLSLCDIIPPANDTVHQSSGVQHHVCCYRRTF